MDVTTYLREKKARVRDEIAQVTDFSIFDFDFIPPQPLMRNEVLKLIDEMIRFDITGIATHCAIIGTRGSGKTLMLKYLQREVPNQTRLQILYANCRHHNTTFKILAHLLGVQARGTSLSELFTQFCACHPAKTVVVLDEIDLMSKKDPRKEILYLLSRSEQPFMVVMLANGHHILKDLDAATRSSLQPMPIHFKNYDADQIAEILKERAKRGLKQWDEAHLAKIAALTTKRTNADARVAIKTLYYAVTDSEADLETSFERARRDVVVDLICDLSDHTLMILWAAATCCKDLVKEIYKRYRELSQRQRDKPISYVYFYSNLSYLQSAGLVALIATRVGRTQTNRVLLTFDREAVRQICQVRFEK